MAFRALKDAMILPCFLLVVPHPQLPSTEQNTCSHTHRFVQKPQQKYNINPHVNSSFQRVIGQQAAP